MSFLQFNILSRFWRFPQSFTYFSTMKQHRSSFLTVFVWLFIFVASLDEVCSFMSPSSTDTRKLFSPCSKAFVVHVSSRQHQPRMASDNNIGFANNMKQQGQIDSDNEIDS